jgi:hypothetical protein
VREISIIGNPIIRRMRWRREWLAPSSKRIRSGGFQAAIGASRAADGALKCAALSAKAN